ncbi:hypothetical protein K438DRAFT_1967197 [Mycena galopus ATCC 62051]|nr:hypothetical protein K438DRAFT_1967197 [Mycena galopus ATCC 62051]
MQCTHTRTQHSFAHAHACPSSPPPARTSGVSPPLDFCPAHRTIQRLVSSHRKTMRGTRHECQNKKQVISTTQNSRPGADGTKGVSTPRPRPSEPTPGPTQSDSGAIPARRRATTSAPASSDGSTRTRCATLPPRTPAPSCAQTHKRAPRLRTCFPSPAPRTLAPHPRTARVADALKRRQYTEGNGGSA